MGGAFQSQVQSVLASALQKRVAVVTTTPVTLGTNEPTVYFFNGAAADTINLAAPVAGGPGTGDDGKELTFITITAHAHVVKAASAGTINGADQTATSSAAAGNILKLVAFNGGWWVESNLNFTLS